MRRIAVIGGGISGLAAAWAAVRAGRDLEGGVEVTVLEREAEVGGKARSVAYQGFLAEGGPGGFLAGRPALDDLIRDAGLERERVTADPAAARRFLYRAGRMRRIVANPAALAASGILTVPGTLRLLAEPFIPRGGHADETAWAFAARRIGAEAADRLVAPMALGVYAGDARQLAVAAAFPKMAALEQEHGSLVRGLIAKKGRMTNGPLTSFTGGMQRLPLALAERGGFAVRRGAVVEALHRDGDGFRVGVAGDSESLPADGVIIACEPWAAARLLEPLDAAAAGDLEAIPCPPVSVVSLGLAGADAARIPSGFGMLIARGEGLRALGNLWDSRIFPHRGPAGHVLVRFMYGGAVDPEAGQLGETELVALARAELERLYGIRRLPVFTHVQRWARAIPQYVVGHQARVARIDAAAARLGNLFLAGFGLRGVAFADAAVGGIECGQAAVRRLRQPALAGVS